MFVCFLKKRAQQRTVTGVALLWLTLFSTAGLANTAPVISSQPDTKVNEDNRYSYTIVATDEDGDALTYSAPILPTFLSYNSSTQTISGTPANSDVGFFSVRVEVSDGASTVSQQFSLEVVNTNDAPTVLSNIDNQTISEDAEFTLTINDVFIDEDAGDKLTFTADNLPSGLVMTSGGTISGAPDNDAAQNSPFTVEVIATDKAKASVSSSFQIVVINVNDAPQPFDDVVLVNEDNATTADVLENDIDVDNDVQPSTLFIVSPPTHGSVTTDSSNGMITYTPDTDYAGSDALTYRITDPDGAHGTATVTFNVVNSNDAPIANNDTFITEEDVTTEFDVIANDTDIDEGDAPQGSQIVIELTPTNGSVDINNDKVRYVPNLNFVGTDVFYYKVADKNGAFSNVAKVHVTVGPVNDIPVAGDDVAATLEDQSTYFVVLNNDSDTEDSSIDPSNMAIVNRPTNGSVSIDIEGNMTYVPNADFNGTDTFQYTVTDSDGLTSLAATVTVTVNPVNDAPIANSDITEVNEDNSIQINILGNDTDIDSNDDILSSSIDIQSQPSNGELFIDTATGIVRYTPAADFNGTDTFTYQVMDKGGLTSQIATVQIDVKAVNDAPRLKNDSVTTDEDTRLVISVLDNDYDVDGTLEKVTLKVTQQPVNGSVSINSQGQISYIPRLNFFGTDQFSYNIADNNGLFSTSDATVLVTVNSVNDMPTVTKGTGQTFEDKATTITLIGNDVDGDVLSYSILQQPAHGTLSGSGATRTYTPDENYNGADSFIFRASDGQLESLSNIFVLDIVAVNDRPVAIAQTLSMDEDSSIEITFSGTDIDGDDLTFSLSGDELQGTITGSPPTITYRPPENFNGQESVLFVANDGQLDSARQAVTINVDAVNDEPTAESLQLYLDEDSHIAFSLSAEDIDGDTLSYIIVDEPSYGTLSGTAPELTYTPNANHFGNDKFSYKVNDGTTDSQTATVNFEIAGSNDAPLADAQSVTGEEDTSIALTLTGSDPDGNDLNFQLVSNPSQGTLSGDAPNLTYIPNNDYVGSDSFQFKVSDGNIDSDVKAVSITITPVNDAPVAIDDYFNRSMTGVSYLTLNVLANDSDIDGDILSIRSAQADIGTVAINNSQLRYAPPQGFVGDVLMHYLLSDPDGETATATVYLKITDNISADAPIVTPPNDISVIATGAITKVELGTASAVDKNGNQLPVELLDAKTNFRPGIHTVFWRATDSAGKTAMASQKISVFPQVSVNQGQAIEEGSTGQVIFKLTGPAPSYPITIPYTVSGTATAGIDYELSAGQIRFDKGTEYILSFNTFVDSVTEQDEYITVTIGDTPYKSLNDSYRGTLIEHNVAPRVELFASQNNERRLKIAAGAQLVGVTATIVDANVNDSHSVVWQADERIERFDSSDDSIFIFSAENLSPDTYPISATVTDDGNTPISVTNTIYLQVVDALETLGSSDADGDLRSDAEEGHQDSDGDNIPDYLDPNDDCRFLPEQSGQYDSHVVFGENSGCLRLGRYATAAGDAAAMIDPALLPADGDSDSIGGLFDFQIHGLDTTVGRYAIVLPQQSPIPDDAIYRKYTAESGWRTFVEDSNNKIYSTKGSKGVCPSPRDPSWQQGLSVGHWCVQLVIEDGGVNDDDGELNGSIADPGGVSIYKTSNNAPQAYNDFVQMSVNTSAEFSVLDNDTDADNDELRVISAEATLGQTQIVNGRRIYYSTATNFVGVDKVNYTISDGRGGIDSAVLNVTINGNSAPVTNNDNASTTNDKSIVIDVLGNDTDADGDTLILVSASVDAGIVTINSEQKLKFEPQSGYVGTATITYIASDGKGAQTQGKAFVTVSEPVQTQPPTSGGDSGGSSDSGGGSVGWGLLLLLFSLSVGRHYGNDRRDARLRQMR